MCLRATGGLCAECWGFLPGRTEILADAVNPVAIASSLADRVRRAILFFVLCTPSRLRCLTFHGHPYILQLNGQAFHVAFRAENVRADLNRSLSRLPLSEHFRADQVPVCTSAQRCGKPMPLRRKKWRIQPRTRQLRLVRRRGRSVTYY